MDNFDLRWPKTDATFYTDGNRCRIVWRQKGGIGGSIDNNQLCKRRVADSLLCAPELLKDLKVRGYSGLAAEIEEMAPASPITPSPASNAPSRHAPSSKNKPAKTKPTKTQSAQPVPSSNPKRWLASLSGVSETQECGIRRGKNWVLIDSLPSQDSPDSLEQLYLKPPAARGAKDWVLTQVKRKSEYLCAKDLKGIFHYLLQRVGQTAEGSDERIEKWLSCCHSIDHAELSGAVGRWRSLNKKIGLH